MEITINKDISYLVATCITYRLYPQVAGTMKCM